MHEHDSDLIAALAEGSLGAAEASAAEASFAACPECTVELAAQRAALSAVAGSPRPGLTMAESANLRRGIEAALGMAPETAPALKRRSWLPLATAAAVIVVLIAVAPLINLLSTDADGSAASDTTVAATAEADATAPQAAQAPIAEAPATTTADTRELASPEPAEDGAGALEEIGIALPEALLSLRDTADLDELLTEAAAGLEEDLGRIRSLTPDEVTYFQDRFDAVASASTSNCSAETALAVVEDAVGLITIGTTRFGDAQLLIVVVVSEGEVRTLVALDTETCEVAGVSSGG